MSAAGTRRGATSARPGVSVPASLLDAYRAAELRGARPLSTLLDAAMRDELCRLGVPAPTPPPPARTAAATAARSRRRLEPTPGR